MICRTLLALGVAGAASFWTQGAGAAVTVLGNGLAETCYEAAEFGGNPKDGIAACGEALDQAALTTRDRAATLINRGIIYSRIDETQLAIADYSAGLALDPSMGEGYVDRGAAMIVLKRYDDALEDINKGIALNSKRLQIAYYDRAIIQEALGNVRAAYEDYKKAAEIEPDFALANAQLARFKVIRSSASGS